MAEKDPQKSFKNYMIAAIVILALAFVMSKAYDYVKGSVPLETTTTEK